jgi:hypothetical protein
MTPRDEMNMDWEYGINFDPNLRHHERFHTRILPYNIAVMKQWMYQDTNIWSYKDEDFRIINNRSSQT